MEFCSLKKRRLNLKNEQLSYKYGQDFYVFELLIICIILTRQMVIVFTFSS
ncbi:MAG: hypothetical protein JWP44_4727 [Mucilaginibacter sp.]|nr:hypothetical protein [Mucilaginibacter sp.]